MPNPARFINEKLTDFSFWIEDAWSAVCDWFTEDWWFIPLLSLATIAFVAWLLTGGVSHFRQFPFG